jgi:hypothetical protein
LADDPRLVQGITVIGTKAGDIEAACAIGYVGWQGGDLAETDEVEKFFEVIRDDVGAENGGTSLVVDTFTMWFDQNPLKEIRPLLLYEVNLELARRSGASDEDEERLLQLASELVPQEILSQGPAQGSDTLRLLHESDTTVTA